MSDRDELRRLAEAFFLGDVQAFTIALGDAERAADRGDRAVELLQSMPVTALTRVTPEWEQRLDALLLEAAR